MAISNPTLAELKKETARDAVLQELIAIVQKGWPEKSSSAPIAVRPYYHLRSELIVEQGLVFKGHRCIVPSEMRPEILRKIHLPHMGLESALRFGRQVVFWPDMNSQLKDLIQKCEVCCSLHAKQPREPLQPHPIPERPWEVIGVDLFSLEDSAFLVTVDYYSGFWEIDQLQGLGATSVIRCLKRHFARYGIPVKCVTDNGPQFSSEEFRRFSTEWGFTHTTSSPEFPQSNGKAESGVKVAKSLLRKAWAGNEDPWLAILGYRHTPTQGSNTAPVQRFLGRRTRTQLPTRADQLLPGVEFSGVQEHLQRRQDSYQKSFGARAHALKPLVVGK